MLQQAPGAFLPRANLGKVLQILAQSELAHGRDPSAPLQRSEKELRQALKDNPRSSEAWGYLGETHALQLRWKAHRGQARDEDFSQVGQDFEQALTLAPDALETRLASASLQHAWALWKKDAGRAPTPQLERGLALVEEVLKSCPEHPEALLLRAKLSMIRAGTEARADEQQAWRMRAKEDLSRATARNPHLASGGKE
jgi:serine/threonine-protein kinase